MCEKPRHIPDFTRDKGYDPGALFFNGHFDGRPIVPAAVLLAQLSAHLEDTGLRLDAVKRMKFVRPLAPETEFQITFEPARDAWQARFTDAEGTFAQARIQVAQLVA